MSYAIERATIEQVISGNFNPNPAIPVVYDNVDAQNDYKEWIRASIFPADAAQISLGPDAYHRYVGVLVFQIFVRPDSGAKRAIEIADTLSALFRSQKYGTITFRTPVATMVGLDKEWYQVNLSVNFFREE